MIDKYQNQDSFMQSIKELKEFSINYGYNNIAVLKNSLVSYEILNTLLQAYIEALHKLDKLKSRMILQTIPTNYLVPEIIAALRTKNTSSWVNVLVTKEQQKQQIRLLNDYLTSITDNTALRLFRQITGQEQITLA